MEKLIETNVIKPEISFLEGEQNLRAISIEDELYLDTRLTALQTFTDNNHGLGKTEAEKDQLYFTAQSTWKEYVERLKTMQYTFYLNRNQYNFLTNLLVSKLEYDVNTIFLAIELTNMLGNWEMTKGKKDVKGDKEVKAYTSDATEITYMYHLIAKHKVKGLTHDTYFFAEILRKIGRISKIVSYYDNEAKTWNKDIQDWATTFEPNVFVEGKDWGRIAQSISPILPEKTEIISEKTEEVKPKKNKKKEEDSDKA